MGNANIDQPRLLLAGNHFNGKSKRLLRLMQKAFGVFCNPQRICSDRAHGIGRHTAQPLAKAL